MATTGFRVLIGALGIVGVLSVTVFFATADCFNDMCGNDIVFTVPSPDGKLKAVEFVRDCGASTGFSTQISVLGSGMALANDSGNVFVIDNRDRIALSWKGNATLVVRSIKSGFLSKERVGIMTGWFPSRTVNIEYRP